MSITRQPGVQICLTANKNLFEIYESINPAQFVKVLLSQAYTSSLEMKDALGYTLLHKACLRSDTISVAALLFVGASPTHHTLDGVTAIHLAASRGLIVVLNLLVKAGGNLDHRDNHGRLALHYAADAGQVLTIAWLLHHPSSVGRPDSDDAQGVTPLHLACARGHCQALEYMVLQSKRQGYPLNLAACDRVSGSTCLHALFGAPGVADPSKQCDRRSGYASSAASSHNVVRLVWQLLLWQLSATSGGNAGQGDKSTSTPELVSLCQIRNHAGETALDLAKGAPWQVLLLLRVFHHLLDRRPHRARHRLLRIYSSVWWLMACLPLLSGLGSLALVSLLSGCQWIHLVTCLGLMWLATRQRHRLDDGTDRPNPFFAGTVWAGLITTSFSFLVDISLPHLLLWLTIWLFASAVALLFLPLLLASGEYPPQRTAGESGQGGQALASLVETQSELVYSQLHDSRLDTSGTQRLAQLTDLYCPHCDLLLGTSSAPVDVLTKHCKLCRRCFANMDHHCLFIMRCVHEQNQHRFLLFLLASVCFTGSYVLAASATVWARCQPPDDAQSLVLIATQLVGCAYSALPQCLVLWPFNLAVCLWGCVLANDQCLTLASNRPYHLRLASRRYRSCLCSAWLLHYRAILAFLVTGRRPVAPAGVKPV